MKQASLNNFSLNHEGNYLLNKSHSLVIRSLRHQPTLIISVQQKQRSYNILGNFFLRTLDMFVFVQFLLLKNNFFTFFSTWPEFGFLMFVQFNCCLNIFHLAGWKQVACLLTHPLINMNKMFILNFYLFEYC